ncbi:class I SAM-dependent rRNA methyltransferase [bacterium]|nr:class I SAM-dependent rRNA methyltransferase [candidate division CSSED10-310 bacterium]
MNPSSLPLVRLNDTGYKAWENHRNTFGEECIAETPSGIEPGATVSVICPSGHFAGIGYFNRLSRLPLRLLSREAMFPDREFWINSIQSALMFRHRFYTSDESFRIVFGEADQIPGLIVDKFGSVLSVQVTTAGIERHQEVILDVLEELLHPEGIFLSCDCLPRKKEGLPLYRRVARGEVRESFFAPVDGVIHAIDCLHGHKTGFFLDHRLNRHWTAELCKGKQVLDLFSYSGAFGIRAALHQAEHVLCVDIFEPALTLGRTTARFHDIESLIEFKRAEAFAFLNDPSNNESWDVIFLDPPSFVRGNRRAQRNQANYRKIAFLALNALAPGGILVTSCCSFHVSRTDFIKITENAFIQKNRDCRIFRIGSQSPDHPILPSVEGTDYLKCLFTAADN